MLTRKPWPVLFLPLAALHGASAQPGDRPGGLGPGGMMGGRHMMGNAMGPGMMGGSMARHRLAMTNGIPEPYRSARNPLPDSPATLKRGAEVYAENCASCHGANGAGDGPAGQQLSPRPASLAWTARSPMISDQYTYWAAAEGGQPVGSAMPAFKGVLPPRDLWAVVTYVRHGLGARRR